MKFFGLCCYYLAFFILLQLNRDGRTPTSHYKFFIPSKGQITSFKIVIYVVAILLDNPIEGL